MVYAAWGNQTVRSHDNVNTGANVAGSEVAVTPPNSPQSGERTVNWRFRYAVLPTAQSIRLQGSMSSGVGNAEWTDLDTAGDAELPAAINEWVQRTVDNVRYPFLRVMLVSSTGGGGLDSEIIT